MACSILACEFAEAELEAVMIQEARRLARAEALEERWRRYFQEADQNGSDHEAACAYANSMMRGT
jgi:hypothetical protein